MFSEYVAFFLCFLLEIVCYSLQYDKETYPETVLK